MTATFSTSPIIRDAPMPPGDPVLGHLRFMRKDMMGFYVWMMRTYGPVVRFRLGKNVAYLVSHPDDVRRVLHENYRNYSKQSIGHTRLRAVFGNGLVTSEGDFWLRQRRIAQPAFHREKIAGFAKIMTDATTDMMARWEEIAEREETVDIAKEMMLLSLRIVSETLLGTATPENAYAVGEAVQFLLGHVVKRITALVDLPLSIPTKDNRRFHREMALVNSSLKRAIDERRRGGGDRGDLLSMLIDARDEETGQGMSDQELRDELVTMFIAGHETTASALSWTLYLLSKNPGSRRKLRDEALQVLGDRIPTTSDISSLKFADRVMKEGLRLYAPVATVGRRAVQDDVLGGFRVPKDAYITISPYVSHRVPEYWPNPDGFDPDRFLPEEEAKRPKFAYYPFLAGPRICIGNTFAMTSIVLVLSMLARRFELDLVSGQNIHPQFAISLRPKFGIKMRVRKV